jgi:hypothetical protein
LFGLEEYFYSFLITVYGVLRNKQDLLSLLNNDALKALAAIGIFKKARQNKSSAFVSFCLIAITLKIRILGLNSRKIPAWVVVPLIQLIS